MELLTFLRRAHGRDAEAAAPRKITLQRKSQQEIKLASTQGRARTVAVEVRRKKTYLNRTVLEEEQRTRQEEVDRVKGAEEAQRLEAERQEAERRAAEQSEREPHRRRSAPQGRRGGAPARRGRARVRRQSNGARARGAGTSSTPSGAPPRSSRHRAPRSRRGRRPSPRAAERPAPTKYGRQEQLHVSADASARFKKKQSAEPVPPCRAGQRREPRTVSSGRPPRSSATSRCPRRSPSASSPIAWRSRPTKSSRR